MASSNPGPHKVVIVDELPPTTVLVRSRRGGRLRSLGSISDCGSSSQGSATKPSSSRARAFATPSSSSKDKDLTEALREPIVDEIVPE